MNSKLHILLLLLTAFIWGVAFVAQTSGANHVGPFTFLAARNILASIALLPFVFKNKESNVTKRNRTIRAGILCGLFLFLGSLFQQIGIASTTTAKSGFITALYMVFVPLLSTFQGKKIPFTIWLSVVLGTIGLYLLCVRGNMSFGSGELWTLACALCFALQIMAIHHSMQKDCDPILLTEMQFITCTIISLVFAYFEAPSLQSLQGALPAILYAGFLSSGVGYTLQTIGQQGVNPTVASIIMCLESVFSTLAGWLLLHQSLTMVQVFGCCIMFIAILTTQIPQKS